MNKLWTEKEIKILKENYGKYYYIVGILGTKDFLNWVNSLFNNYFPINKRTDCKNPIYKLTASCNKAVYFIKEILQYPEIKNLVLKRKWGKFEEI